MKDPYRKTTIQLQHRVWDWCPSLLAILLDHHDTEETMFSSTGTNSEETDASELTIWPIQTQQVKVAGS